MVMSDDPAPPGHVEQRRTDARVLEVEQRNDLPGGIEDDIDRREVTVDEGA
jgi:hypothetical protein